jgi:glycosyltransferase involved in cell wall biosynthesis
MQRCAQSVDAFFALSEASAKAHQERGFASPMRLLPNFVSAPEDPVKLAPHSRPYFLFVGRLEKYKGLQDVIPLFTGDGDYDLLILGEGGYEQELRRLAHGSPRVHFTGWIGADRLGAYYQHARALVAPSLTYETFGMVVVEALARSVPVIARDLGAYPELLAASGGGLLFRDTEGLAECLQRIGADDLLRARLGESARIAYANHWTPEAHVDHYLRAIDEVRKSRVRK